MNKAQDRTWQRRPRRDGIFSQLGSVARNWPILTFLLRYNIKNAYQRAILGMLWLAIRPLVMVAIATIVLRDQFGIGADMAVPYPLYVLGGISCFILFSRSIAWQTRLLYKLRRIMMVSYVPRLVYYYSTLSPAFVEYLVVLVCFLLGLTYFLVQAQILFLAPPAQIPMMFPAVLLLVLWSQTITLISSVLQLYAKDTWFTLRYLMPVLMVITPIFYPLSEVPADFQTYIFFNPLTAPVLMYQWALLDYGEPHWMAFGLSFAAALLLYVASLKFFVYWESQAVDENV
jgi:ABC-type polysaccharide/polyol phosphate export permease